MASKAFFLAGDRVFHIANPSGAAAHYHAHPFVLGISARVEPRRLEAAETVIVVEEGIIEVMVNGAVNLVAAGGFARIPAGTWFAYSNAGKSVARLLVRTTPPVRQASSCNVVLHIQAA